MTLRWLSNMYYDLLAPMDSFISR